jgi:ADP-ribose pyrophosphatase YjhB (NUDIX family)
MEHKNPTLTVDAIIEENNKIVLITRAGDTEHGKLALPGGHVEVGELVESAAIREIEEETNLKIKLKDILGVYSDPKRDPRGHYVSTVFIAKASGKLKARNDASKADFYDPNKLKKKDIASDHFKIIKDYLKYKKQKGTYWSTRR